MSDFEFVLVEKIGFTLQTTVFEFVVGGGRGPSGPGLPVGGIVGQIIKKSTLVDHATEWFTLTKAFIGLGNVTDDAQLKRSAGDFQSFTQKISPVLADSLISEDSADGNNKKRITLDGIKTLFQTFFSLIYASIFNRLAHGTITVSKTLNATTASEHTGDFTTSWTATIAGLTPARPSMLFQFVVSGSGSPTVTVSGATFTFATTQNFTSLEDGTYQAIFSSVDDNSNVIIYVKLMP